MLGVPESFLDGKHQPCLLCGGHDRARFTDHNGKGSFICNQCRGGDGFDLLTQFHNWTFAEAAKQVELIVGVCNVIQAIEKPNPAPRLKRIAQQAERLTPNCPVNRYLTNRGLKTIPAMLRLHPNMDYFEDGKKVGSYPAMLAVITAHDGDALSYHVTYLTPDGKKAPVEKPKKVMSPLRPIAGSAVRLFPLTEGQKELWIAEGIETAIAVHQMFDQQTWSVLSTSGMESFQPPEGIETVVICADNDKNFAGQKSAFALANRLVRDGIKASVEIPDGPGNDFLDQMNAFRQVA